MKPQITATAAEQSEGELIEEAKAAVSSSQWTIGRCASTWHRHYASGRTDADFGSKIGGVGARTVNDARRTVERFGPEGERLDLPGPWKLSFTHYLTAVAWDDAEELLGRASSEGWSTKELRAFGRMQHGEDLTKPAEPEPEVEFVEPIRVPDPAAADPAETADQTSGDVVDYDHDEDRTREKPEPKTPSDGSITDAQRVDALKSWNLKNVIGIRRALTLTESLPATKQAKARLIIGTQLRALGDDIIDGHETAEMVDGLGDEFVRDLRKHLQA